MAEFFQVLTMMAAPAAILLLIRHLIVRQNRIAQAPSRCARMVQVFLARNRRSSGQVTATL